MAPKRGSNVKPRPDQERWEWVKILEKLHSQDEIHQEHIHKSYAIDATKCERGTCRINCKKNPNCHNHLGEKFWSNEIKDSYWIDVDDPEEQRKDQGSHVGLKNLGATCYVNTFLQLWFHNPEFRSAIFKWVPSEGYSFLDDIHESMQASEKSAAENEDSPSIPVLEDLPSPTFGSAPADNICGNLQLLFALMKYSEKRFVDPTPFVQSLGLQTDEQQDAQEFSKLFMSLLESSLSNQSDSVKDLVQDQYGGQYAYETRCTVCGKVSNRESNFYELDLSIQGHRQLKECIKEFLKEEKLHGDNRYFCANCHMKQDATRRIVLQALPRVLNLQLLRFVFDRDTGCKRKCNTSVRFPELLDMNDFMRKGDPSPGIYELTAVLIHCGISAYSGHYVAHILDKKDEVWYRFNDETVEKMKGKKLELGTEEDPEDAGKNSNKVKSGKGQHCSKNAYMLVYTRKGGGVEISSEVEPPDFIQNYVANSNILFDNWVSKIRSLMDSKIEEGRSKCEEVLHIYNNMHPESVDESEWIATEWLKKWLADKQKVMPPIDNSPLLCKHGRFDVCKVHLSKRVSTKVADILFKKYGGLPRMKYDSLCARCVYNQAKRVQFDEKLSRDKHKINNAVKTNYTGSNGFWVGKSSLRQWKQLAIAAQDFDSIDGALDSEFVSELDESLNLPDGNEMKNGNESISSKLDNVEAEFYESKEDSNLFSGMREEGFNSDVQCQNHGNLCIEEKKRCIVSTEVWSCLKYYFKDCPEFRADDQPCLLCQEQSSKKQVQREVFRSLANMMRTVLHDLYQNHERPELHREVPFEVYAVCKQTIEDWRRFLRSVLSQPYELIENSDLFCEHGKLLFNSDDFFNPGSNDDYILVTKEEWNSLSSFIPFDREIKLSNCWTSPENMFNFSVSCECCDDCRMIRVIGEQASTAQYFNAPIYIRKIADDQNSFFTEESELFEDDGDEGLDQKSEKERTLRIIKKAKLCRNSLEKEKSAKRKLCEPVEGQRKSARHRMQRGEYMIKVNSSQTLKEVKIQLLPIFSVIPCDQHLSFADGTPLADDSLMLSDLGVLPGSILLLRADEPNETAPVVEVVTSNGQRKLEEGFKGTGLCGVFQSDQNAAT